MENSPILQGVALEDIPDDFVEGSEQIEGNSNAEELVVEDSQKIKDLFDESYIKMDEKFLEYLGTFIEITREGDRIKRNLKVWFFRYIMLILLGLIICQCFVVCYASVHSQSIDSKVTVAICGILIENLTALIILPRIIAEYLFNKEEDKNRIDIIKSMQNYNEHKDRRKR